MEKFNPVISAIINEGTPIPDYHETLEEIAGKLREREAAMKELNLADKKNRVLKAENARLYKKIDDASAVILSHENFIEKLTEYNARLLQENRALRQELCGTVAGQLAFNLDSFWEAISK